VQAVINSLIIIGLLVLAVLVLVVAVLLRDVRALQAAMATVVQPPKRSVPAFAGGSGDTFVLAVSLHCGACELRASALAGLAETIPQRVVLLSADADVARWVQGSSVEPVIDAVLLGDVGADVTPLLLRYDPDGNERFRQAVGSDADLSRLVNAGADVPRAEAADRS
jgi:hypothetical protein